MHHWLILPELGHFALILALLIALGIGMLPFLSLVIARSGIAQRSGEMKRRGNPEIDNAQNIFTHKFAFANKILVSQSKKLSILLFITICIAYAILTFSFLSDDFSVLYVATNSSITLPWWYKFCAVWGGHEGSMLLWVLVLSGWMSATALLSYRLPDEIVIRTLSILGLIAVGFLLFLLITSDPFARLLPNIPANGRDLNPLLQDIGFLFHPPVLYMGYVGFSVPFALVIAALWSGRLDSLWAAWSRPWTLAAWCFLTLGITLGSWWAYRELGWGGWWFWDPVENASFMPWVVGTALLHSLLVTEKRNTFKAWTALLAIVAFLLSLLGTFLVRSGILTSVHSFAVDPQRGLFMLIFLLIVMCISSVLYAWRAVYFRSTESFSLLSRETFLMLNNVMLAAIMCTILLGTLYPLGMQALHLEKLSVGAPYFNTVFSLLMLPILFIMGLGPLTFWKSMPIANLMEKIRLAFLLCLVLGLLIPWLIFNTFHPGAALGIFLAIWIMVTTLLSQPNKRHWGMLFAHLGIAVCLAGIVVSTSYSVERNVVMAPGDTVELSHYTLLFKGVKNIIGPNYEGLEGVFVLQSKGEEIGEIHPEKRYYPIQQTVMTDAAIDATIFRDIYIALGEKVKQNHHDAWIIRLYYKPLIRWIWGGGFLILLGGIFAGIKQARKSLSRSKVDS